MSNTQVSPASPSRAADNARDLVIFCYVLYLTVFIAGVTPLIGLVIAYIKRGEARGTIWESHYDNLITVFWVALVLCLLLAPVWALVFGSAVLAAVATWPVGILALPLIVLLVFFPFNLLLLIWYLYRTIKGITRALDGKAYS